MKIIINCNPDADTKAIFNQFKEWCDLALNGDWSIEIEGTSFKHNHNHN